MKKLLIEAILILLIIGGVILLMSDISRAEDAWVICQPDSFVYIRSRPSFDGDVVAMPSAGDLIVKDGRKRGSWIHVSYPCEAGEGWIFAGYVGEDEPEIYPEGLRASTDYKKVRTRRYVDGPFRKTLKKGTELTVYIVSGEWTITNQGFVKTKYLVFEGG